MSHPIPTHDYSEQHKNETSKQYAHRRATALGKNKTQQMTSRWLKEAGESLRRPGEAPLSHLKRVTKPKAKALKKHKPIGGSVSGRRTPEEQGEAASDFERGN